MTDVLRVATIDDAAFIADVLTAGRADDPVDPVMFRHEWKHAPAAWRYERFVITRDGHDVGFCGSQRPDWAAMPERVAFIQGELLPAVRSSDGLVSALKPMETASQAAGASVVVASTRAHDTVRVAALTQAGYREDRRGKRWELDLVANHARLLAMTEETRARMTQAGIQLLPLARDVDPDRYRKLWRLSEDAAADIPSSFPHVEESLDDFIAWLKQPGISEDRIWIARRGDEMLGISVLEYPPVRGIVNTAWTATSRTARGAGIARALKCETIAQAIGLGVDRVRTGNDAKNVPILHLNETMGYRLAAERIDFRKEV